MGGGGGGGAEERQTALVASVVRIIKESGPIGLYKGFVPTMLRAFPANGAAFGCIALAERYIFGKTDD